MGSWKLIAHKNNNYIEMSTCRFELIEIRHS